jgi:hypothetical protein
VARHLAAETSATILEIIGEIGVIDEIGVIGGRKASGSLRWRNPSHPFPPSPEPRLAQTC